MVFGEAISATASYGISLLEYDSRRRATTGFRESQSRFPPASNVAVRFRPGWPRPTTLDTGPSTIPVAGELYVSLTGHPAGRVEDTHGTLPVEQPRYEATDILLVLHQGLDAPRL